MLVKDIQYSNAAQYCGLSCLLEVFMVHDSDHSGAYAPVDLFQISKLQTTKSATYRRILLSGIRLTGKSAKVGQICLERIFFLLFQCKKICVSEIRLSGIFA